MKKLLIIIYTLIFMSITACTESSRAKNFGGNTTITLEYNQVFKNITWKERNLWVLYQDTISNNYFFEEYSAYGILQGKVIIKQNKKVDSNKTFKYNI